MSEPYKSAFKFHIDPAVGEDATVKWTTKIKGDIVALTGIPPNSLKEEKFKPTASLIKANKIIFPCSCEFLHSIARTETLPKNSLYSKRVVYFCRCQHHFQK